MTARDDAVVAVGGDVPVTRVFRPGDIVREDVQIPDSDAVEYHYGTVLPLAGVPASPWPYDPERVWVEFRGIPGQHSVPAAELALLDIDRAVRGTLDLLAKVGITVTRHEVGISPDVAALICDEDEPGEHEHHARSLVLWFESMDDVDALTELTYFGPFEFGCNWPSVYGTDGLRGLIEDGPIIRGVHLADLADLADLAERELSGEFGGDPKSIRRRWLHRSAFQLAILAVAITAVRVVIFGRPLGWLGALGLALAAAGAVVRIRRGAQPPRTNLDAVRRRSSKGGPR